MALFQSDFVKCSLLSLSWFLDAKPKMPRAGFSGLVKIHCREELPALPTAAAGITADQLKS